MPSQDIPNPQAAYLTGGQGPTIPYAGQIEMQFVASAAITSLHIVTLDATGLGTIYTCTAILNPLGVCQNTVAIGGTADVIVEGFSAVIAGAGGTTLQTGFASSATGTAIAATTVGLNGGTAVTTTASAATAQVWVHPY